MKKVLICFFLGVLLCFGLCCAQADEQGSFRTDWFSGGAMGMTFTDIVVDEDADVISIWPNTTVKNVVLEKMKWQTEAGSEVICAMDTMESNQVINLKAYLSDVMPDYRITCESNSGETERWYLTMSGEDGAPILLARDTVENLLPSVFDLSALENIGFTFASGVGAWMTDLRINGNGSFYGGFHDSDMGDTGEGYPNGTVYGCLFHGQLSSYEFLNEYTVRLKIDLLEPDEGQLPEVYEDRTRYITTEPYGLSGTDELLLYLPGTPVERLPEGYVVWAKLEGLPEEAKELPGYGLYNVPQDAGFLGFELAR